MLGFVNAEEVMRRLGISRTTLYRLGKESKLLRPYKLGKGNLYKEEEVEDFLSNIPLSKAYLSPEEIRKKGTKQGYKHA